MRCPQCSKSVKIPDVVYLNVETYGKPSVIMTDCCKKPIVVRLKTSFILSEYRGGGDTDHWGNKIKAGENGK